MAASSSDNFRSATSGTRPENAYLTASKSVGSSTITVSTTTGWATDTGTDFVLFQKDTLGNVIAGTMTTWVGTVSDSTINNLVLKAGTEPVGGYPSGENSVVIATPTAAWNDSLIDGILTEHNQDGSHGNITATTYAQASGSFSPPDNSIARGKLATVTRKAGMYISGGASSINMQQMVDSATTTLVFYGLVPDDYVSGNLTIKYLIRPPAVTGTLALRLYCFRMREAAALVTIDNNVNVNQSIASSSGVMVVASRTVNASNIQAGDLVRIDLQRLGADAADTLSGNIDLDTMWMEYTGRA